MTHYYNYKSFSSIPLENYILVTGNKSPAIDLKELKKQLRETQGVDDFDDQLKSLIEVATEYGELITGRDFLDKTYKGFLDCFPPCDLTGIQVRKSRLSVINSIKYLKDGVETTIPITDYYATESNDYSSIFLNEGKAWPTDVDNRKQAVIIEFVAGYGNDSCNLPAALRQAVISHIVAMFKNAGDCAEDFGMKAAYIKLYRTFILADLLVR